MTGISYRKSTLAKHTGVGILHFGLGAFHRAHQAVFTEDAMLASGGNWGIESVSMRDGKLAKILNDQDGRFTLVERKPNGPTLREITSIKKAWSLPDEASMIADRMADPSIHIVTVTVTEKGYCANLSVGELNRDDTRILHDINHRNSPKTLLGILTHGLSKRMQSCGKGVTLISCDNLPNNGKFLRAILLEFASVQDAELAKWIDKHCTFPCSMVDRITPATSEKTLALTHQVLGADDEAAVETEPFSQWVIEDKFAGPRPDWEAAGVLIVDDVAPYEMMKLRMLNGAHSLIAYLGTVEKISTVRDVMADPLFARLVQRRLAAAATTLSPLDGFNFAAYANDLVERFSNPSIEHLCSQIAMDGSQKMPQRILAPMQFCLDRDGSIPTFALTIALWVRHIQLSVTSPGFDDLNDPLAVRLGIAVENADGDVNQLVASVFSIVQPKGTDIRLTEEVGRLFTSIVENGVKQTIRKLLS